MDRSQKRILMAKVIGEYIVSLRRDKGIAQKKHVGKITGNHKENLHTKSVDEVVEQSQPP